MHISTYYDQEYTQLIYVKNNIEDLEESVVYIEMVLTNYTKEAEYVFGSGSGSLGIGVIT